MTDPGLRVWGAPVPSCPAGRVGSQGQWGAGGTSFPASRSEARPPRAGCSQGLATTEGKDGHHAHGLPVPQVTRSGTQCAGLGPVEVKNADS